MKKLKNILFILLLGLVTFTFTDVDALSTVKVGTTDINSGETKNIYGGTVSLIDDVLTLNGVTINTQYNNGDNYYSIYTTDADLNIKLVGKNTINATYTGSGNSHYYGIYSSNAASIINLNDVGELTFNVKNYKYNNIIDATEVNMSNGYPNECVTINVNLTNKTTDNNENVIVNGVNNIIKSNFNINALNTYQLIAFKSSDTAYDRQIVACNIYFNNTSNNSTKFFTFGEDYFLFKNNNIYAKTTSTGSASSNVAFYNTNSSIKKLTFKNTHCYIDFPTVFNSRTNFYIVRDEGTIDTLLGGSLDTNMTFSGVLNLPGIVTTQSSITNKQSLYNGFSEAMIPTYKYVYFSDAEYSLVSGDNQDIDSSSTFTFSATPSPLLIETITIDDTTLTSSDYIYDYEGNITLTSSGINKIKTLGDGSHVLHLNYFSNKTIDVNFTFTNTDTDTETDSIIENLVNPETFDNIVYYVITLLLSLTGLTIIVIYKKKNNI